MNPVDKYDTLTGSMMIAQQFRSWLPSLAVVMALALAFSYYSADHRYPVCCDTAVTLIKAKRIAQAESVRTTTPYNPYTGERLYGSPISSEFPLHVVLASIFRFGPAVSHSLTFAKAFFVVLFMLPALSLFLLGRLWFRSAAGGILTILITYFIFWYGNMYWTGHVAQMLGMFFLSLLLWSATRFEQTAERRYGLLVSGLLAFLFFVHVLTFLVGLLVTLATVVRWLDQRFRAGRRWLVYAGYAAVAAVIIAFFRFLPATSSLLPRFEIYDTQQSFDSIFYTSFGLSPIVAVTVIGVYAAIRQRQLLLLTWLLATYILTQSDALGTPFFAYRFTEFSVVPLGFSAVLGLLTVARIFASRWKRSIIVAGALIVFLPFGLSYQQMLRQCYIQNCAGLHPTQVPTADLQAFAWMREHLDQRAIVSGIPKFGYYLTFVTDHPIEFPDRERQAIFTSKDSARRWQLARQYDIRYIFWDAIFAEQGGQVREAEGSSRKPLENGRYFRQIYYRDGTYIYEVL